MTLSDKNSDEEEKRSSVIGIVIQRSDCSYKVEFTLETQPKQFCCRCMETSEEGREI